MLSCPKCSGIKVIKNGKEKISLQHYQKYYCNNCGHQWHKTILIKFKSEKEKIKQRYLDSGIENIGYLDIETDGQLKGDFGEVLTAVLMIRNIISGKTKIYKWIATKKEATEIDGDRRIIKDLFNKFKECDLLIGHYFNGWKKFDMPFLRVRAEMLKIKIPTYKQLKYGDTWNMAHSVLNLQSYSLDGVARGLGIRDIKTKFDARTWKLSRHGNKKALLIVLDHNYKDVLLTFRVHKKLEKFVSIPSSYV